VPLHFRRGERENWKREGAEDATATIREGEEGRGRERGVEAAEGVRSSDQKEDEKDINAEKEEEKVVSKSISARGEGEEEEDRIRTRRRRRR